jgi:NAD(P)-dependent dehydrogenase (short-subunit alcohol dehydrogenase family)
MGQFAGKVAIITGGNRGIGRAAAVQMARAGAKVVVTGRDAAAGAETEQLIAAAGGEGFFCRHDVTSEADWERVVGEAVSRYGGLDIVVNNAGVFLLKDTTETTEADWDHVFDINTTGTWLGVKHGFLAMSKTGRGGSIVNVSSLMGLVGYPQNAAYCASKGAVTGMTKSAANEGAGMVPPIRVNSLHPGVIYMKGAVERLLERCATALDEHGAEIPFDKEQARGFLARRRGAAIASHPQWILRSQAPRASARRWRRAR